ncbi:restriction endonuclease subunit S [Kocuria rhizophila]
MSWSWTKAAAGRDAAKDLPQGWGQTRIVDVSQIVNGAPFDSKHFGDLGEPLLRIRDLLAQQVETRYDGPDLTAHRVTGESLLVGMDGDFNVGRWGLDEPALLNQRVLAIETSPLWSKWIEFCLPSALKVINDLTYATTVKHLTSAQVAKIRIPSAPQEIMRRIVDHLDHETAEIDALISDFQLLIARLRERQSVAGSHLLAKYLQGATRCDFRGCISEMDFRAGSGAQAAALLSVSITWGVRRWSDGNEGSEAKSDNLERYKRVVVGDLILNRMRAFQGAVGVSQWDGITSPDYAVLRTAPTVMPVFAEYLMRSDVFLSEVRKRLRGIGSDDNGQVRTPRLSVWDLKRIPVHIPSLSEQESVVARLVDTAMLTQERIEDAVLAIALARERRAALITAAVTGQIDVTARHKPAAEQLEDDIAQGLHREN